MADSLTEEQRFEIGEVAILAESNHWPEYNGQECTITGPLATRRVYLNRERTRCEESATEYRYLVTCADGHVFAIPPHRLRKRRPPQDWEKLCQLDEVPTDGVPA